MSNLPKVAFLCVCPYLLSLADLLATICCLQDGSGISEPDDHSGSASAVSRHRMRMRKAVVNSSSAHRAIRLRRL